MSKGFTAAILIVLNTFFSVEARDSYRITGTVTGFKDSTLLFLGDANTSKTVDSTYILNNRFEFKGELKEVPAYMLISTADHSDYKFFWLENTAVSFNAEKGKFRNAVIKGSKTQEDANLLEKTINPIRATRDSISKLYYADTTAKARALLKPHFKNLDKQEEVAYQSFIRKYSGSLVSASVLSVYKTTWAFDTVKALYQLLSSENKKSEYGQQVTAFVALYKDIKVGDQYADFTQPDTSGKPISLSQFKGKTVLVEFWASWCYGCVKSNPALMKIYNEFKPKGFEVLGVSLDKDRASWIKAIERDSLSFANVSELKGDENSAALIYGINGIPDNILIDKSGIVVARNLSAVDLKKQLEEMLK